MNLDRVFDVIVAGGGAAGCVLASRLSEDPVRTVLLLEAGPDAAAPGSEHPDILDPFGLVAGHNRAFFWPGLEASTTAAPADGSARTAAPWLQGYSVGGGSNVNGMGADRGQPDDYDRWRDAGADGWGWDEVLPYFIKLEHDLDFDGPVHGADGPMPVSRVPRERWAPFTAAIAEEFERRGYPYLEDYMTDPRDGVGSAPMNRLETQRVSAAMAYLTREVRSRPNLTIVPGATVERITFEGTRATGVVAHVDGDARRIEGREVVVSCGAIHSPALLLRSGLGPSDQLERLGVEVVRDLPGVGANLQNHPCVQLVFYLPGRFRQPEDNGSFLQNWMRLSSNHPDCQERDLHLIFFNKMDWHQLGSHIGCVAVTVIEPYSTGSVELAGTDPFQSPKIEFNTLDDPRDWERLVAATRLTLEVLEEPGLARMRGEVFLPNFGIVAKLAPRTRWNAFRAAVIAGVLNRSLLRRFFLGPSSLDLAKLRSDPEALEAFVRANAHPQVHPTGTCRMGRADDPGAVVDGAGRVHGVEGVRVADCSIFPSIPRGYTHFLALMTGEKLADAVKASWLEAGAVAAT
jgi:5-(hydroxymethyl)furfural/furfural oxidase